MPEHVTIYNCSTKTGKGLRDVSGGAAAASGLFGRLGGILKGVGAFLLGPWGIAIAAVIGGAILLWRNWDRITKAIKPALDGFKAFWTFVKPFAKALGGAVVASLKSFASGLLSAITPGKNLGSQVHNISDSVGDFARHMIPIVNKALASMTKWLKDNQGAFKAAWASIKVGFAVLKAKILQRSL